MGTHMIETEIKIFENFIGSAPIVIPRPSRRIPILLGVVHLFLCLGGCSDNNKGKKVALILMRVPHSARKDKDEV